jgi:hypothetical protein
MVPGEANIPYQRRSEVPILHAVMTKGRLRDVYLLEQWDAPLPIPNTPGSSDEAASRALKSETAASRSKRLIRQFLALAQDGRQVWFLLAFPSFFLFISYSLRHDCIEF